MTYLIGYTLVMHGWQGLLVDARQRVGWSQLEMARRAGTSRPTLSAYEHGKKAPTADTLERLLEAAGVALASVPSVSWTRVQTERSRSFWVPDRLWRLPVHEAFAEVILPLELDWSAAGRRFMTRDRRQRARLYEVLLREGEPEHLERWMDGALLVDAWDELVIPRGIRSAWQVVLEAELAAVRRAGVGHVS